MDLRERIRESWKKDKGIYLIAGLFLITQIVIVKTIWNQPPIWDASVYIGMGKRLFSSWQFGIWEAFRPLMLPVILGILWKLGIPMIGFPYLLSTLAATAGIVIIYYIVKDIADKRTAIYSAGITASTSVFYSWSFNVLTGIPASILIFIACYNVYKEKELIGGIFNGIAFLTRFPSAIVGPALAGYVFLRDVRDDFKQAFINALYYTAGFFAISLPFFAFSQHLYGNFLRPVTAGASVPLQANPDKFLYGLFYLKEAIFANPLLLLMPLGAYIAVKKREQAYGAFGSALIFLYAFFTIYQHKDPRFMLIFLPLLSLFAARGLSFVESYLSKKSLIEISTVTRVFLVVFILFTAFNFSVTYTQNQWSNDARIEFLNGMQELDGVVAGNDPVVNVYGDFEYVPLRPENLNQTYGNVKEEADYYVFDSGSWYCNEAIPDCKDRVDEVVNEVDTNHIKKVQLESYNRSFTVYEVENR